MAKFGLVPTLTSATSNPPYVITHTYAPSGAQGYMMFDGKTDTEWSNGSSLITNYEHYVTIDVGEEVCCNAIEVVQSNSTGYYIKTFRLSGSNDDIDYVELYVNEAEVVQTIKTASYFEFENKKRYRYYKFQPLTGKTTHCRVTEMQLYWDTDRTPLYDSSQNVSRTNVSLSYSLPMNTTKNIKGKKYDDRVGRLGMANDDENFGDLYVVGKDGKSHLTKSGIKSEILFDGLSKAGETIVLPKTIDDFSYLVVCACVDPEYNSISTLIVDTKDEKMSETFRYMVSGYYGKHSNGYTYNYSLRFSFKTKNSLLIDDSITVGYDWANAYICKIIGIY